MARRSGEKGRYWYFRFRDNFFMDEDLMNLELLPGGYEYIVILLKLYARSVQNGGIIRIPTFEKEDGEDLSKMETANLAKQINHDPMPVIAAVEYFVKKGFLLISTDDDEVVIDVPGVKPMIGKSSQGADAERNRLSPHQESLPAPRKDNVNGKDAHGEFGNVYLTEVEYKKLNKRYENADYVINRLSLYYKRTGKHFADDYAAVLSFGDKDGIVKVQEREKMRICYERYKREALQGFPPPAEIKEILTKLQFEELERIAEEKIEEERNEK